MKPHLRYLSYVLRHKWFVLLAGLKTDAPTWRLLIHDWSKFTPAEWFPYVQTFYGRKELPHGDERLHTRIPWGWGKFDSAWLHHQHRNPHHWQHWVLREDDGGTKALAMPEGLIREMVADWMGAGRAITGKWNCAGWYAANAQKMVLHPDTRAEVDYLVNAHGQPPKEQP